MCFKAFRKQKHCLVELNCWLLKKEDDCNPCAELVVLTHHLSLSASGELVWKTGHVGAGRGEPDHWPWKHEPPWASVWSPLLATLVASAEVSKLQAIQFWYLEPLTSLIESNNAILDSWEYGYPALRGLWIVMYNECMILMWTSINDVCWRNNVVVILRITEELSFWWGIKERNNITSHS